MLQDSTWHTVWGVREHGSVSRLGAARTARFPTYVQLADVLLAHACINAGVPQMQSFSSCRNSIMNARFCFAVQGAFVSPFFTLRGIQTLHVYD